VSISVDTNSFRRQYRIAQELVLLKQIRLPG
jgi:hypothetical protein